MKKLIIGIILFIVAGFIFKLSVAKIANKDTFFIRRLIDDLHKIEIYNGKGLIKREKITISAAPGSGPGLRTYNAILVPPFSKFSYAVSIEKNEFLEFGYCIANKNWENTRGAQVFKILISESKNKIQLLYQALLKPAIFKKDRKCYEDRIDLNSYAGKKINLIFNTVYIGRKPNSYKPAWINPTLIKIKEKIPRRPNVILISIDTLRADHLSSYGYYRQTTPNIDKLAKDGILFKQVIAQAPFTLASHMSLMTSLYPSFHKTYLLKGSHLDNKITTLAEVLYSKNYKTWAITGGGQLNSKYGFSKGFEIYTEYTAPKFDVEKKVNEAINFIEKNKDLNFFIFLHSYKPHAPYTPEPPFDKMFDAGYKGNIDGSLSTIDAINNGLLKISPEDKNHIVSLYDGEIREVDNFLGKFFSYLRKNGLYDNSLIIFTSDHGEEFGEHGKIGLHSHTLYDELLLVPLIIKLPSNAQRGKIVYDQVQSIDIFPTILQLIGVKDKSILLQGSSIANLIFNKNIKKDNYAFTERLTEDNVKLRAIRGKEFKFIYEDNGEGETYYYFNLNNDPKEQNNIEILPNISKKFIASLNFLIQEEKIKPHQLKEEEIDRETTEILKSLGYIK